MINFVSNLPGDLRSGGFSAMNAAALAVARRFDEVNFVGPIDPPQSLPAKAWSKALRLAGRRGDFAAFSRARLRRIAGAVGEASAPNARFDFFHGFTPWVLTRPQRAYMTWSDCTFRDYIQFYHRRSDFSPADLERVERAEAGWLARAEQVAFTSRWAAERAVADYGLDRERVAVVGIFGEIEAPDADLYAGGQDFAFVSTNFEAKGGRVAVEAFRRLRERHPSASLTIVGDCPVDVRGTPGLGWTGYLRKEVPQEYARLRDVLSQARAVVHPTRSDISPLLLVEAAYFGCPAISSARFAIPEIVEHGGSGLLLDDPGDPAAVAAAMELMLADEDSYRKARAAAWRLSRERHSKSAFEARLVECLRRTSTA